MRIPKSNAKYGRMSVNVYTMLGLWKSIVREVAVCVREKALI